MIDTELIQKAGLTKPQALVYLTLIQTGALTPAEIAEKPVKPVRILMPY